MGGFAGLFRIGRGKLLAAATDGVGTKLEIARLTGRLDTVGIDLVAMCADDVVCTGAEPLFFLDYLAVGRVVPERVAAIVGGVAEGCRRAGCALLGGETAEHAGVMEQDRFDLGGFCVGAVDESALLGPAQVREGDLVRSALLERHALDVELPGLSRSLADELLEPCEIYVPTVLSLARAHLLHAAAHITGGGFYENIPRALPPGLGAEIRRGTWPEHSIFSIVQQAAGADQDDMFSTFNMGVGMVLVADPDDAGEILRRSEGRAWVIGSVRSGPGVAIIR